MLISPLLLSKEKCKAKSQSRLLRWPFVNNEKKKKSKTNEAGAHLPLSNSQEEK